MKKFLGFALVALFAASSIGCPEAPKPVAKPNPPAAPAANAPAEEKKMEEPKKEDAPAEEPKKEEAPKEEAK